MGEFRQVGEIADYRRRVIRAPVNPADKATIVSIFPKEIDEVKYTIQPGRFHIRAGSVESPAILLVGPSSWWREVDEEQPLLEIPVSSIQIADSVVKDYCVGLLGYLGEVAGPGLFYVPGAFTVDEIKKQYASQIALALNRQTAWYKALVRLGDSLWARSNNNPLTISDDMRMAARELGQDNKEWLKDYQNVELVRCSACGALKNPAYPVCGACRAIDQNHPNAKNLKFAV